MSDREIRLHQLVGRTVRDSNGHRIGRLFELEAIIELREHGNEYVVATFHVGSFGAFEWLAGSHFARHALLLLGRFGGHRRYSIPWQSMDLSDPSHPRVTSALRELVPVAR
jgi:sporulation protein YlmC with PRC-barrel domain